VLFRIAVVAFSAKTVDDATRVTGRALVLRSGFAIEGAVVVTRANGAACGSTELPYVSETVALFTRVVFDNEIAATVLADFG
jgi:hypothetical protein